VVSSQYRRGRQRSRAPAVPSLARSSATMAVFLDLPGHSASARLCSKDRQGLRKATPCRASSARWKASWSDCACPGLRSAEIGQALKRAKHVLPVLAEEQTMRRQRSCPRRWPHSPTSTGWCCPTSCFRRIWTCVVLALSEVGPSAPMLPRSREAAIAGRRASGFWDLCSEIQFDCIALMKPESSPKP